VKAAFTGAHLLRLAAAGCLLNDVYREAVEMGMEIRGVRVTASADSTPIPGSRPASAMSSTSTARHPATSRTRCWKPSTPSPRSPSRSVWAQAWSASERKRCRRLPIPPAHRSCRRVTSATAQPHVLPFAPVLVASMRRRSTGCARQRHPRRCGSGRRSTACTIAGLRRARSPATADPARRVGRPPDDRLHERETCGQCASPPSDTLVTDTNRCGRFPASRRVSVAGGRQSRGE